MSDFPVVPAGVRRWKTVCRWTLAGLAGALMPKCVLCVAGYVILFTGAGAGVKEICGAMPLSPWVLVPSGVVAGWIALAAGRLLHGFRRPAKSAVPKVPVRSS